MSIPGEVKGAGNGSIARNVFKVVFSAPTNSAPALKAWDAFCPMYSCTVNKKIFTGTIVNGNISMISGVATTDGAPVSNWKPAAPIPGGAVINRLKGDTNYIVLSVAIDPGTVTFNLCWEIPSDAGPEAGLGCIISLEYAYYYIPPVLTWYFNDKNAGGTEAVPVWAQFTSQAAGNILKPTNAGVSPPDLEFTLPQLGVKENPELWVDISPSLLEDWLACLSAWYYGWDPQPFSFLADLGTWYGRLYGAPTPSLYVQTVSGLLEHLCAGMGDNGYIYLPNSPSLHLELTTFIRVNHKYWTSHVGDIKISFRDGSYPGWVTVWEATLSKTSYFTTDSISVGIDLTPYANLNFVIHNNGQRDECIDWVLFE